MLSCGGANPLAALWAVNAISIPAPCCQAAWRESPLISRTNG
jgi:hypothetical protein